MTDRASREIFARRLREHREARQLNQTDLATLLGVTRITISKWETGKTLPTIDRLFDLADLFDVPVARLVGARTRRPTDTDQSANRQLIANLETELDTWISAASEYAGPHLERRGKCRKKCGRCHLEAIVAERRRGHHA